MCRYRNKASILDFFKKFEWLTAVMLIRLLPRISTKLSRMQKKMASIYRIAFQPQVMAERYAQTRPSCGTVVEGVRQGTRDSDSCQLDRYHQPYYVPDTCMRELDALHTCRKRSFHSTTGMKCTIVGMVHPHYKKRVMPVGIQPARSEEDGPIVSACHSRPGSGTHRHAVSAVRDPELMIIC
jgi:hypothetical protein